MKGVDGRRCPEFEHAPQTIEGRVVMSLLKKRLGVWYRLGMDGSPAGINLTEAIASMPPECDSDRARALLIEAEAGYMDGYAEMKKREKT